jgi:serine protease Do
MSFDGFGPIAESLRRSTVQVTTLGRRGGQGSGFIARSSGVIVTNAHVINRSPLSVRLWDGSSFPAKIAAHSVRRDLAVLQIPATHLTPVTLGDSDELRVGELVVAIGNPLGFTGAVSSGVVHAIGRREGLGPTRWIHAGLQLAPGNSGGPLADARGRVVGVNTMIAGGVGLAVPSNLVKRLLAGKLRQSSLGMTVHPTAIQIAGAGRRGFVLVEVTPGGAAHYASLRVGDVLLSSIDEVEEALEKGARLLRLEFLRGDPTKIRTVVLRPGIPQANAA